MELEIDITRKDFLEFNKTMVTKKVIRIFMLFFFMVSVLLESFNEENILLEDYLYSIFMSYFPALILFPLIYVIMNWFTKRTPKKEGAILGKKKIIIDNDGILEISLESEFFTKWNGINNIIKNKKYIYLLLDKHMGYIIPIRNFINIDQKNDFLNIVYSNTNLKKKL